MFLMADINDGVAVKPAPHEEVHSPLSQYIPAGPESTPADTKAPSSDSTAANNLPQIDTTEWNKSAASDNRPSAPDAPPAPDAPAAPGANPYQTPAAERLSNINQAADNMNKSAEEVSDAPMLSDSQEAMLDNADAGLGKDLWRDSKHADITRDGKLGAAASVSVLLQQSGYTHLDNASIRGLEQDMKNSGFEQKPVDERQPGDVIIGDRVPGGQRIYVQAEDGQVYGMRSDGKWSKFPMPQDLTNGRVLRAPGTCGE